MLSLKAYCDNFIYRAGSLKRVLVDADTLFTEHLYYNESHGGNTPDYRGNISAMEWKAGGGATRAYNFAYDYHNRLREAVYKENGTADGHYSTYYDYDRMGNITYMQRNGKLDGSLSYGLIDDLELEYDGNRLTRVYDNESDNDPTYEGAMQFTDNSDEDVEYEYDTNGNMTKDLNSNITSIQYNCLNLPSRIYFTNRHVMDYVYNADGELLQMSARALHQLPRPRLDTKYYVGNVVYFPGKLSLLTDEGYVTFASNGTPTYHYYLKDHLGNVRVVFNQTGTVEQRNDYYPSGALMATSTGGSVQPYKYNGKELERIAGLDLYDYGARWMDSKIGARFTTIDPMCEKYYGISPYAYCAGNPVNLIDPDGRIIDLSRMSDNERESYKTQINILRNNSELFNNLYSSLESSKDTYFIQYGDTDGDGFFKLDDNGGGEISFSNRCLDIAANVMSEELFHAYQYDNRNIYEQGEFNYEFEAKVFAVAVCEESGNMQSPIGGVDEFQLEFSTFRKYGNDQQVLSPTAIMSNEFVREYKENANRFYFHNITHDRGNTNYRKKTNIPPCGLQRIIKQSYK